MIIGGVLLLAILIFGLRVLFGSGKIENYIGFLIWLVFASVLLAVAYNHLLWFWSDLPLWMQILSILLMPFFLTAMLKKLFPKAKWLQGILAIVFHTLIYILTFPIRLLWRTSSFVLQRERRMIRLNPRRPVVGGRPPVINQPRRENRSDLFD